MSRASKLPLFVLVTLIAACSKEGEQVYRTWVGPERSNMVIVTLRLGGGVGDVTLRERVLPRSRYGTIEFAPGKYTLHEQGEASVAFTIRPILVDAAKARAAGELVLGNSYVLRAGKFDRTGERALWIEDARSGEVFIESR
jgi:hypothetical protein